MSTKINVRSPFYLNLTEPVKPEPLFTCDVAKVTHNPEAETKRNLNLFAQKRPMTTADKVMQRIANIKK